MISRSQYRLGLLLITLLGLAIRLYIWEQEAFLHTWDEKFHALVAKNMMQEPFMPRLYPESLIEYDYRDWTANYIWLHKMPLFLWESALSMKACGISLMSLRLPSLIKITVLPLLVAGIAERLTDRRTALLASIFAALSFQVSMTAVGAITTDHSDISLLFYFTLALLCGLIYNRQANSILLIGLALATAGAMMSKSIVGLAPVLIVLLEAIWTGRKARVIPIIIAGVLSAIPLGLWLLYTFQRFALEACYELSQLGAHSLQAVEGHHGSAGFYIVSLFDQYGPLLFVAIGYLVYFLRKRGAELYYLIIVPIVIVTVFSIMSTKMHNYILLAAPMLWIALSYMITHISDRARAHILRTGVCVFLTLGTLWSVAKPDVIYKYLHREVVGHFIRIPDRSKQLAITESLQSLDLPSDAIILGAQDYDYIDMMFYHDVLAYPTSVAFTPKSDSVMRQIYKASYQYADSSNLNSISLQIVSLSDSR